VPGGGAGAEFDDRVSGRSERQDLHRGDAETRRKTGKRQPLIFTDDTDWNREIGGSEKQTVRRRLRRKAQIGEEQGLRRNCYRAMNPQERGSGGLAAQFRESPGGINKVLEAQ
jgi:hypothetical protein